MGFNIAVNFLAGYFLFVFPPGQDSVKALFHKLFTYSLDGLHGNI